MLKMGEQDKWQKRKDGSPSQPDVINVFVGLKQFWLKPFLFKPFLACAHRHPALTDQIMQSLDAVQDGGCLAQLQAAGLSLDRGGLLRRPEWAQLRAGARPPLLPRAEPGEQHGWQCDASSPLEPLQGDRDACPIMRRRPSSLEITSRTVCQRRLLRSSNSERVRGGTPSLPQSRVGEAPSPTGRHRCCLRVRLPIASGSVRKIRKAAHAGCRTRENSSPHLP